MLTGAIKEVKIINMNNLNARVLDFLYQWVKKGNIAHIRKNMVEELEAFINAQLAQAQVEAISQAMSARQIVETLPLEQASLLNDSDSQKGDVDEKNS